MVDKKLFNNLIVLELANNHLGNLNRGISIIDQHSTVVRDNNIRAAIKLQFRDRDSFIHSKYVTDSNTYIDKVSSTFLSKKEYMILVNHIKKSGCIPMATAFDEPSVDLCLELDLPIIKIASSSLDDWPLIYKIIDARIPVIISTGGSDISLVKTVVKAFEDNSIPLAINHCVSEYPSRDSQLNLQNISKLKSLFPNHIIGFSSHEYNDWHSSILLSYGLGARTWERHIDINTDGVKPSSYNSLPHQIDTWVKALLKAIEMLRNTNPEQLSERNYLDIRARGLYSKKKIPKGTQINLDNVHQYLTFKSPLLKNQLSVKELIPGFTIVSEVKNDAPINIRNTDLGIQSELYEKVKTRGS